VSACILLAVDLFIFILKYVSSNQSRAYLIKALKRLDKTQEIILYPLLQEG
jgi:hypothetical protein